MSLPANLVLQTNKSITSVDIDRITIRQSERGLVQNVTILNADKTAYDLTGKSVQFSERKAGDKIIIDNGSDSEGDGGLITYVDRKAGRVSYRLAKGVYAASGKGYFEIISSDNRIVDTTQEFYIDVQQEATLHVNNDNYVSELVALENHYRGVIQNAATQLEIKEREYQEKYAKFEQLFNEQRTSIQTRADQQIQQIQTNADKTIADKAAEIDAVKTKATQDLEKANSDFQKKITDIQNDYNSWKTSANADFQNWKNQKIQEFTEQAKELQSKIDASNTQLEAMKKSLDEMNSKLTDIDFTMFVKSVNSSRPDSNGNVNINYGSVNLLQNSRGPFRPQKAVKDNYVEYSDTTIYLKENTTYSLWAVTNGTFSANHDSSSNTTQCVLWMSGNGQNVVISNSNTGTSGNSFYWNKPTGQYHLRVNSYITDNSIQAEKIKIVVGNFITPNWSPAPEDVDTAMQQNKDQANLIDERVTSLENDSQTINLLGHDKSTISNNSHNNLSIKRHYYLIDDTFTNPNALASAKAIGDAIGLAYQTLNKPLNAVIAEMGSLSKNEAISALTAQLNSTEGRVTELEANAHKKPIVLTNSAYNALTTKDPSQLYIITDD